MKMEDLTMKKLLVLALAVMALFQVSMAIAAAPSLNTDETVVVRKSDLPPQLLKELEARQELAGIAQRVETYGKWVGIGKEVGTAVNDSLSAITVQADNFAKTGVGQFTMFIVAYKILGKSILGVIIGIPLLIVWTVMFAVFWHKLYNNRVILDRIENKTKFYKVVSPAITGDDRVWAGAFLFIGYFLAMLWTISGVIL
ncbi:MAG: hypothetical protein Q8P07_03885 [bacterium]|nr:hypothetical protein [bacterium]